MNLQKNQQFLQLLRPDAVIHMNGTRVEIDGVVLYEELLDSTYVKAIIDRAYDLDWCIGISQDSIMYTTNNQKIIDMDTKYFGHCDRTFRDIREILNKEFHSLIVYEDSESIDTMAKEFPMLSFAKFTQNFGADIFPLNLSKATGMSFLLTHWSYEFKDVISVGDSMNDYEILQKSGIGIAMGNADETLKKIADIVTDDIGEDGILNAFTRLGMI
ncbi:Sugar phosphatase YbiV [compost metagenome]